MSPATHAADAILALFQQAERGLSVDRAEALSREITTYRGLEPAIAAMAHDEAFHVLDDALAYRTLLAQCDSSNSQIDSLLIEAGDLDTHAAPAWAEAADRHGRAAFRRAQGDLNLAMQFLSRAEAAERIAAGYEEQALNRRMIAAELKANGEFCNVLRALAA